MLAAKHAENHRDHGDTQSWAYDFAAGMCPRITQIDEEELGREKAQDAQDEGGLSVTGRFRSPLCASAPLPLLTARRELEGRAPRDRVIGERRTGHWSLGIGHFSTDHF